MTSPFIHIIHWKSFFSFLIFHFKKVSFQEFILWKKKCTIRAVTGDELSADSFHIISIIEYREKRFKRTFTTFEIFSIQILWTIFFILFSTKRSAKSGFELFQAFHQPAKNMFSSFKSSKCRNSQHWKIHFHSMILKLKHLIFDLYLDWLPPHFSSKAKGNFSLDSKISFLQKSKRIFFQIDTHKEGEKTVIPFHSGVF